MRHFLANRKENVSVVSAIPGQRGSARCEQPPRQSANQIFSNRVQPLCIHSRIGTMKAMFRLTASPLNRNLILDWMSCQNCEHKADLNTDQRIGC